MAQHDDARGSDGSPEDSTPDLMSEHDVPDLEALQRTLADSDASEDEDSSEDDATAA